MKREKKNKWRTNKHYRHTETNLNDCFSVLSECQNPGFWLLTPRNVSDHCAHTRHMSLRFEFGSSPKHHCFGVPLRSIYLRVRVLEMSLCLFSYRNKKPSPMRSIPSDNRIVNHDHLHTIFHYASSFSFNLFIVMKYYRRFSNIIIIIIAPTMTTTNDEYNSAPHVQSENSS